MKRCPNCTYENAQTSMYCERCGTLLSAPPANSLSEQTYASLNEAYTAPIERPIITQEQSYYTSTPPPPPPSAQSMAQYQVPIDVPPPPPPSPLYSSMPTPNYGYSFPSPASQPSEPRKRSFGAALLSSLLYLLGAFCFVFGVAGFMLYGTSTTLVGLVFIVLSIVALIVLIPLLIVRKYLKLKWWVRILIVLGITIVATAALFIIVPLSRGGTNYPAFSVVFVISGLITAIVAFW